MLEYQRALLGHLRLTFSFSSTFVYFLQPRPRPGAEARQKHHPSADCLGEARFRREEPPGTPSALKDPALVPGSLLDSLQALFLCGCSAHTSLLLELPSPRATIRNRLRLLQPSDVLL